MLKSRRGFLAAGLVVAVVGTLGVVSTMQASADDAPGAVPASPDTDAGATDTPLLPWGAEQEPLKVGKRGESSSRLRAEGLDAAPPASYASSTVLRNAPKGFPGVSGVTRRAGIAPLAAAPSPATSTAPPPGQSSDSYTHSGMTSPVDDDGNSTLETDGAYAWFTIEKPPLAVGEAHSLAELAVKSADNQQVVEVGWTVNPAINNGSLDPHLFVYHWINGKPTCYNISSSCNGSSGFEADPSAQIRPGAVLPSGVAKKFGILYVQKEDRWEISYDTKLIGWYPGSIWRSKGVNFTRGGFVQAFGEIASQVRAEPCSQMGNGVFPPGGGSTTSPSPTPTTSTRLAAGVGSLNWVNTPDVAPAGTVPAVSKPAVMTRILTGSRRYGAAVSNGNTLRYGGPVEPLQTGACKDVRFRE